ncbi:hypothetical protein BC937DRAFT_95395 [Endogone sp. FLAS-F59071]|nr:hypothetical protein BC937DRAFT_95395 [Endogone sp. FLAS-F59071]|eukprot:RUS13394.1 hypothetical protein BC937DRAFT_95395 [Endogone sp. FLAS-F59071]
MSKICLLDHLHDVRYGLGRFRYQARFAIKIEKRGGTTIPADMLKDVEENLGRKYWCGHCLGKGYGELITRH